MNNQKKTGLELLREPFPANQISLLPKPYKKDAEKGNCKECGGYHGLPAAHIAYVGHAALTDRLLDADPYWTWEPLGMENGLPKFDSNGGLWIKLTVAGVTRLGYGNAAPSQYKDVGAREKEVIGDALRNAAMRFGAALELWHKGNLHEHLNENEEGGNDVSQVVKPAATPQQNKTQEPAKPVNHAPGSAGENSELSDAQIKRLYAMSKALGWSIEDVHTKIRQDFKKGSAKELTKQEYTLLTSKMQVEIDKKNIL